jgi:hypothetical protein
MRMTKQFVADQAGFGPEIDFVSNIYAVQISANSANANRNAIFEL